jgi:CRISPR-associated endonuclease/helicase Cas3
MLQKYEYSEVELKNLIINHQDYLAHLSNDGKKKETLIEHLLLVQRYFFKLVSVHQLDTLINRLVNGLTNDKNIRRFVIELFIKSIVTHDFGKVNPEFQNKKMKNKINGFTHELSSGHSLISGYIFTLLGELIAKNSAFTAEQESIVDYLCLSFSYPILKHHSSTLIYLKNDLAYSDKTKDLSKFSKFFRDINDFDFINEMNELVFNNTNLIIDNATNFIKDKFSLFALLKLNYSLLTASDYLATSHFMNNWGKELLTDFGVFDNKLKKKIIRNIESTTIYNKTVYSELDNYKLEFPTNKSNPNLNKLRQNLSVETITGIRNNLDKNLFYIEAPTGGGKTNLSMLAIAEFLRNDIETGANNITKVFYVFPFTTLITQTFKSLKETLGLNDDEIVQIHSKAGFSQKGNDDNYGIKKLNIIDYQFVNYPIALLSHIKFFDILKSNRKSANYLLHRLANSIVIIDELQTYSPSEWDKVIYFINKYAKYFNIKFILMSATLPKIDKLLSKEAHKAEFEKEEFVYLNQNKKQYFQNPNFAERIEFDFSMQNNPRFSKDNKEEFLQNIWLKLIQESEDYKSHSKDTRVHTIIEFIFKKSASEFMELVDNANNFFEKENVFILSGTTLEPRRREIIAKLKSPEYAGKDVLLITTQVVEAGVDIDMDLGFKDTSLLDSDEQLAGRINRNVSKPQCKLFLFDYDDASVIYGKDYRYKAVKQKLTDEKYRDILQDKDFDSLYILVMEHIKEFNQQGDYSDNLPAYLKSIKNLDFDSVNSEFQLINNEIQTTSIFVPIEVPINIPNSKEQNFTQEELDFLSRRGKYNDEEFVDGEKVWELYCDIIENKDSDFTKQKIQKVIMQGLISKFSFSVSTYSKAFKNIEGRGSGFDKYGFYKLVHDKEVYDYKTGIKNKELDSAIIF